MVYKLTGTIDYQGMKGNKDSKLLDLLPKIDKSVTKKIYVSNVTYRIQPSIVIGMCVAQVEKVVLIEAQTE